MRTTKWQWECRRCHRRTWIWSKARPVKCYSDCNSFGFLIVQKEWADRKDVTAATGEGDS